LNTKNQQKSEIFLEKRGADKDDDSERRITKVKHSIVAKILCVQLFHRISNATKGLEIIL